MCKTRVLDNFREGSVVRSAISRHFMHIRVSYHQLGKCPRKIKHVFSVFRGEIIRCLSEVRFEHKVLGTNGDLTEPCKHQLKVAYLQQEQVEVS